MKKLIVCFILILATLISFTACKTDDEESGGEDVVQENVHVHTPGDWIVDDEVTCYSNGHKHTECSECHEIVNSEIIYATGHSMKNGVCTLCGKSYSAGLEYTSLGNGECYVSYIGGCTDTDILVPPTSPEGEKVVYIGNDAFKDCNEITSVELSEGIQEIRMHAFFGCQGLRNVILPNSIVDIDSYAFSDCRFLESVILGNSLETIGYEAFGFCESLKKIEIPASVAMIEKRAFVHCEALESAKFAKGSKLLAIDDEAFRECKSLSEILIPDSVTKIGKCAFYECISLGVAEIGNGVRVIEEYAFTDSGIDILLLGSGLESIGYEAFGFCYNLDDVVIPASVTTIEKRAFIHCESLQTAKIEGGSRLSVIDDEVFRECKSLSEILIPDSVTKIGISAFYGCTSLGNVSIGNGVRVIEDYAFTESGIVTLTFGSSLESIGYEAFGYCDKLEGVAIPSSVTRIEKRAFYKCESIVSVDFIDEGNLEIIDDMAFAMCSSLREIIIPDSVTELGISAFNGCASLEKAVVGKNVSRIEEYTFNDCSKLKEIDFGGAKKIGYSAFGLCGDLEFVDIPEGVSSIEILAFHSCGSLTEVILPRSIEKIGQGAFENSNNARLFYLGTSNTWDTVNLDGSNPGSVYFYCASDPGRGDYWYYRQDGKPKLWNLTKDAFYAEFYSDSYMDIVFDHDSSGRQHLSVIHSEMIDTIAGWELLHIAKDPGYIFNNGNGLIYKKDLYKYVLYDLLTGEHAETSIFDSLDNAAVDMFMDVGRVFMPNAKPDDFNFQKVYQLIKGKDKEAVKETMSDLFDPSWLDLLEMAINVADNAAEAGQSVARYYALQKVQKGYITTLQMIADDESNPKDLRNAALELIECYEFALTKTVNMYEGKAFFDATMDDIGTSFVNNCVSFLISSDPTGILAAVNVQGKIISAVMAPLEIDKIVDSYYKLRCLVAIENAVIEIIERRQDADFWRSSNQVVSTKYMGAINMLQEVLLLENKYVVQFYTTYMESPATNESYYQYLEIIEDVSSYDAILRGKMQSYESIAESMYKKYYFE